MLQPETPSNSSCLPDLLTERVAFGRRADHFHLPTQSRQARVAAARKETFHESSSGSPDQRTPPSVTLSQPTTESRPARFPDESSSVTGPSHTLIHPSRPPQARLPDESSSVTGPSHTLVSHSRPPPPPQRHTEHHLSRLGLVTRASRLLEDISLRRAGSAFINTPLFKTSKKSVAY